MSYKSDFTSKKERLTIRRSKGFFTARFWRSLAFILVGLGLGFAIHQQYKQTRDDSTGPLSKVDLTDHDYTNLVQESIKLPQRKVA